MKGGRGGEHEFVICNNEDEDNDDDNDAYILLLLRSNAGMVMPILEVDVLDELGNGLRFLLGSPATACPGRQPQMATGVSFRVCGLDSFVGCVSGDWEHICL